MQVAMRFPYALNDKLKNMLIFLLFIKYVVLVESRKLLQLFLIKYYFVFSGISLIFKTTKIKESLTKIAKKHSMSGYVCWFSLTTCGINIINGAT